VGKISEAERFGAKMLAIEPLFKGVLLDPVFHGGAAIYRLTPCSKRVAWDRAPREDYQLPAAVRVVVPETLLSGPGGSTTINNEFPDDSDFAEVGEDR
jgi:hypothetical protein